MIRVKKYSNRRLYDTGSSRYVNLDEIAAMIREGETIEVLDATTGEDLTRAVLLQILLEAQQGAALFPPGLLHRVIRAAGDNPAQRLLFQQIGAAMSVLDTQLGALEEQMPWMKGGAWSGRRAAPGRPPGEATPPSPEAEEKPESPPRAEKAEPPADDELARLRARLASLEQRLKKP